MAVTDKQIQEWNASLQKNYAKHKENYMRATDRKDKKKYALRVKATLKDLRTWSEIAAAERALGRKNLPAELQRMVTELMWLKAFDPDA